MRPTASRVITTTASTASAVSALALLIAGCSPSYVYLPTEQLTAVVGGQPAARYAIPPEAPTGDVRVHSYGVVELDVAGEDGDEDEISALHVELWVSHDAGTRPWTLDTSAVRVELRREDGARPTALAAGSTHLPVVEIPTGEQRFVEMMFPLPEDVEDADALPAFDVLWQVKTETRVIAERTPFERIRVQTPPAGPAWSYSYGYGHGWWYDPFWRPGGALGAGRGVVFMSRETILQPHIRTTPVRPAAPFRR